MAATIDEIEDALFGALEELHKSNGGPFLVVGRWAGTLPQPEDTEGETRARVPAALLVMDGESAGDESSTLAGDQASRGQSRWVVVICVADGRGASKVVKGTSGVKGCLKLADEVIQHLNGLLIPETVATLSVTLTGTPNTTAQLGASVLVNNGVKYRLVDGAGTPLAQVTLNGSGQATVNAKCASSNTLGNLPATATLTWDTAPTGLNATATVASTVTQGTEGTLRNRRARYVGLRPMGGVVGALAVYGVQFQVDRAVTTRTVIDQTSTFERITADVNVEGTTDAAPNPIDTVRVDY